MLFSNESGSGFIDLLVKLVSHDSQFWSTVNIPDESNNNNNSPIRTL